MENMSNKGMNKSCPKMKITENFIPFLLFPLEYIQMMKTINKSKKTDDYSVISFYV